MPQKRGRDKKQQKAIAAHRIEWLFHLAEQAAFEGKLHRADRYVELARKISMRYLVPIPKEFKRRFCTHCYRYLLPGITCRVRISRGMIITYCSQCKSYTRIVLHDR